MLDQTVSRFLVLPLGDVIQMNKCNKIVHFKWMDFVLLST